MSVVNPVTVGAAVRTVGAAWNILTAGGGLNREQREAIEAAKRAGYSTGARGYRDPQGRVVSQKEVLRAGRAAQIALPDQVGMRPSDPGYRPDLTEKRIPPLKRPPPPPKPPKIPKIPGRAGRIIEGAIAVGAGSGLFEVIRGGIERISERDVAPPPPRPAAPPAAASPNEVIGGRSPFYAPPSVKSPPPAPAPRPAAPAPAPRPAAPAPIDTERLSPIDVYVPYAAIPAAPIAPPAAAAAPRSILGMSPAQLAGLAVPTLLALLAGAGSSSRRRRDPLTVPQTPLLPGLPDIPGLGLTPGSFPLPWPGGSGIGGGGTLSATGQCECPPKRKRGPKKRRSVCYSGTYIERASGLSKSRKRKVTCR